MSYRKKQINGRIKKIKPRKSLLKKPWFQVIIFGIIFLSAIVYFSIFWPGIQVKNIVVIGNDKVLYEDIKNSVIQQISHKILSIGNWELSTKSIFLVQIDKLEDHLTDKFSNINEIKIKRKFFETLSIEIQKRVAAAIFCRTNNSTGCYYIDNTGIIFESANTPSAEMPIIQQNVDEIVFTGEQVVQQRIVNLVLEIDQILRNNFKTSLTEALITSPTRLNIITAENWKIFLDIDQKSDINSQINKLFILLGGGISQDSRKNLRYIDLRPSDRAIVCDNSICAD